MDRAAVSSRGVVELVLRRHREVEAHAQAATVLGALTTKWVAAAGLTETALLVPVRLTLAVSVAVMRLVAGRLQRGTEGAGAAGQRAGSRQAAPVPPCW